VSIVSDDDTTFSSTYVRSCIDAGDVSAAADVLGRPHRLEGIVVRGAGRGRELLGYPTANMHTEPYAAMPADGVYAGHVIVGDRRFLSTISIGTNPTFNGQTRTLEPFLLDFDEDLYGHAIAVEFVQRLRGQARYDGIEPLIEQMGKDVAQTRALLGR
jgi:riboflavin kinase/FMN adenylyltransferase